MKAQSALRSIPTKAQQVVHASQKLIDGLKGESHHAGRARRNAALLAAASVTAMAVGGIVYWSLKRTLRSAEDSHRWKQADERLDARLEEAFDSSEAVAQY